MMLLDGGLLDASLTTINFGPPESIKPICIPQDWPSTLNDICFRGVPQNAASYQFFDGFLEIWDGDRLSLPPQPRHDTIENGRPSLLPAAGVELLLSGGSHNGIKRSLADAFEVDELDRNRKGGDCKKARGEGTVEFAHGATGSTAKTVRNVSAFIARPLTLGLLQRLRQACCFSSSKHFEEDGATDRLASNLARIKSLREKASRSADARQQYMSYLQGISSDSAKIRKCVDILKSSTGKFLVFSQWTLLLDLVEAEMFKERVNFCRYDGAMKAQQRSAVVADFMKDDPAVKALLILLHAGNSGLSLTVAFHVVLMDPF
ncbi:hypothetical protein JX266_014099 [Neoarthrinium moseri]|nr:hypothetical protein JX266_014099 [Neoarthrinium moseri]